MAKRYMDHGEDMSEVLGNVSDLVVKTVGIEGKKTVKVELFPAWSFRDHFSIYRRELFFPLPPYRTAARNRYWVGRYRLRVDGRWHGARAKYQMFTLDEVFNQVVKPLLRQGRA